jgi:hypothetical protein
MNATKRLILQLLFWLLLWTLMWFQNGWSPIFFKEKIFAFAFQTALISFLIYYVAPQFLFKKKYVLYVILSVTPLLFFAYLFPSFSINEMPKPHGFHEMNGKHRPPPKALLETLIVLIAYILATIFEFIAHTRKKDEEIIISKNENLQTELKLLKSQINPHFLFNSLNNIYALSSINTEKTQQSISYLSDMLRYVLYECEKPLVSVKKEIDYIENYIKLFSLKSSKPYPIKTTFNGTYTNNKIAPMLLIPFVENAFKHSNIEKIEGTFINLSIGEHKNSLIFKIENTVSETSIYKDAVGGIGLENVKKRLNILYPDNHQLVINESNGVFKVELNLKQHV